MQYNTPYIYKNALTIVSIDVCNVLTKTNYYVSLCSIDVFMPAKGNKLVEQSPIIDASAAENDNVVNDTVLSVTCAEYCSKTRKNTISDRRLFIEITTTGHVFKKCNYFFFVVSLLHSLNVQYFFDLQAIYTIGELRYNSPKSTSLFLHAQ